MTSESSTPSSRQRQTILNAYRSRGRRNNDLFLVYSVKTDQDWILPSCRQFVHWIHFLETNPDVATFDLMPDLKLSMDDKESRATELDAVVINYDKTIEWHEVKSHESEKEVHRSQLLAQAAASSKEGIKYRIFTDREIQPHVQTSVRWLKVISFAAVLRGKLFELETYHLSMDLQQLGGGNLRDAIKHSVENNQDIAISLGIFARLAIHGVIRIDLSNQGLSYGSHWEWSGRQ